MAEIKDWKGQWKTSTGIRILILENTEPHIVGMIETSFFISKELIGTQVLFDKEGYPVDMPHIGELMIRRREDDKW